jgi:hypothetical protein
MRLVRHAALAWLVAGGLLLSFSTAHGQPPSRTALNPRYTATLEGEPPNTGRIRFEGWSMRWEQVRAVVVRALSRPPGHGAHCSFEPRWFSRLELGDRRLTVVERDGTITVELFAVNVGRCEIDVRTARVRSSGHDTMIPWDD